MGDCFSCFSSSDGVEPSSPDAKVCNILPLISKNHYKSYIIFTFLQANFKGPVKGRSCTDCSFLVLFLFVLISVVSNHIFHEQNII